MWAVVFGVVSIAAIVLAVVALTRGAPAINIEQDGEQVVIWNSGPAPAVVLGAFVASINFAGWIPIAEIDEVSIGTDERLADWKRGTILHPQERYFLIIENNTSLRVKYRAGGLLGWLARGRITIHGDV